MKKRLNKKGFTLVELIIVIAILAILVAVLAPQYIKYVSKAEKGVTEAAANDILTVAKTEAALGAFSGTGTITVKGGQETDAASVVLSDDLTYDAAKGTAGTGNSFLTLVGDLSDLKSAKDTSAYTISVNGTDKSAEKSTPWG